MFGEVLAAASWMIESQANTATKERGIDIVARKGDRRLGVEVKGFPSTGYADPARAGEVKRSRPAGQAKSWYAKGVLAAIELRQVRPEWESLLVLPDQARYRQLLAASADPLAAAGVHVVLLNEDGTYQCATWTAG